MITIHKADTAPKYESRKQNQRVIERTGEIAKRISIMGELPAPGKHGQIRAAAQFEHGGHQTIFLVPHFRPSQGSIQNLSTDVIRAQESAAYNIALYECGLAEFSSDSKWDNWGGVEAQAK